MDNRLVYNPVSMIFTLLLAFLLFFVVGFLFLDFMRTAFTRLGFTWGHALLLLLASLIGSGINIPVAGLESTQPMVADRYVRVFGISYRIPVMENRRQRTLLAVNVGGAVIPVLVTLLLLYRFPEAISSALAATAFVAAVTHMVARPVMGLGIVTPALLPPLAAAIGALVLTYLLGSPHQFIFIVAYAGGTLGTLLGADLLNLNRIRDLGAPVASIGGAGTFDGVFLSGLIAVLLV